MVDSLRNDRKNIFINAGWLLSPSWLTISKRQEKYLQYGWLSSSWLAVLIMKGYPHHDQQTPSCMTVCPHMSLCVCVHCVPLSPGTDANHCRLEQRFPFVPQNCLSEENNSEGDTDLGSDLTLLKKRGKSGLIWCKVIWISLHTVKNFSSRMNSSLSHFT